MLERRSRAGPTQEINRHETVALAQLAGRPAPVPPTTDGDRLVRPACPAGRFDGTVAAVGRTRVLRRPFSWPWRGAARCRSTRRLLSVALVAATAVGGVDAAGAQTGPGPEAPVVTAEDKAELAAEVADSVGPDHVAAVRDVGGRLEVLEAVVDDPAELDPFVSVAASVGELRALERAVVFRPDADPLRVDQWALDRLPFEAAHRRSTGAGVTVAVLDAAIAAGHPDLAGRLTAGRDAIDERPFDPADPARAVGDGDHGTNVAGIIAAGVGNGIGIHGAAPGVRVMPVRVIEASGGLSSDVAEGIIWATDNGAGVINISLSATTESDAVSAAISYAADRGAVVVASAGNMADQGNPVIHPAAHPDTLAVGALQRDGTVWPLSSRGDFVDVVAPGVGILSLGGTPGSYVFMTGTSQAAPHASALVALIRSLYGDLGEAQVRGVIASSATDVGVRGRDPASGSGLIAPLRALRAAAPRPVAAPVDLSVERLANGDVRLRWRSTDQDVVGFEILDGSTVIARLARGATSFRLPGAPQAGPPRYRVRALGQRAARSGAVGVAPAPVVAASAGVQSVTLTWVVPDPAPEAYVVLRRGAVVAQVPTTAGPGGRQVYRNTGLAPGVVQRYRVAAVVGGVMGDRSEVLTVAALHPPSSSPPSISPGGPTTPVEGGYQVVTDRGRVLAFGSAPGLGDGAPTGTVIAGAATPSGGGYWLAHSDGRVEVLGDAVWHGDAIGLALAAPVVAMAPTPDGQGYWLLAADGGVFTYGNARFYGSTGGLALVAPVRDLAVAPSGRGYWFVAADGGVFSFGDADFHGSTGGLALFAPVVSMAAGPGGYWLIAADGGVFSFGTPFYGSLPGTLAGLPPSQRPTVVRMRPVNEGRGYLLVGSDGGVYGYGQTTVTGSAWGRLGAGERVVDLVVFGD